MSTPLLTESAYRALKKKKARTTIPPIPPRTTLPPILPRTTDSRHHWTSETDGHCLYCGARRTLLALTREPGKTAYFYGAPLFYRKAFHTQHVLPDEEGATRHEPKCHVTDKAERKRIRDEQAEAVKQREIDRVNASSKHFWDGGDICLKCGLGRTRGSKGTVTYTIDKESRPHAGECMGKLKSKSREK